MIATATPHDNLARAALEQLARNDVGTFVKPAERQYPHQWNWDAALIALGLAPHDPDRARLEVRSLLRGAWANGMIPHILYHHGASDYRPHPDYWRTADLHPAGLPTSGLSQPPILASCLLRMHDGATDRERPAWRAFLEEVYPTVLASHRWWHTQRDPNATGLVTLLHPWESGSDDAPRFSACLHTVEPDPSAGFERADRVHVDPRERPSDEDYLRFLTLIDTYAKLGWDALTMMEHAPFRVQDPFVNAVLHRADKDLRQIARLLGEPHDELDRWIAATQTAFARLHDPATGTFETRDTRTGLLQQHAGFASAIALWGGLATSEQAAQVADRLDASSLAYPLATVDEDDPTFDPKRYWRGPVWTVINWLLAHGLAEYGYLHHANKVVSATLDLVGTHGFREHYDPRDGTPGGAQGFSWTAALTLDLLHQPPAAKVAE